MADAAPWASFFALVDVSAWVAANEYMDRMVDRASMWALRETGRIIKSTARGIVPVRSGTLRSSITNSRMIHGGDHHYTMTVGPHGSPAFLYSGKIEGEHPYMAPGRAAGTGALPTTFEEAQHKVLSRFA